MSFDNVAMFHPHTEIPHQAIIELLNVRCPPYVPARHPLANTTFLEPENLRPYLERVGDYIVLVPADERRARAINMLRSMPEILDDLSKFNQEPPFPSYLNPLSPSEIAKELDTHSLRPPSPDKAQFPLPVLAMNVGWERFALGGAENVDQGAGQERMELDPPVAALPTAPTAHDAQWHDAPTPIPEWRTPLPNYESPLSATEEPERDNETFSGATHAFPTLYQTPRPAGAAPLPSAQGTQAQAQYQPAPAACPSAPAIPAPMATASSSQHQYQPAAAAYPSAPAIPAPIATTPASQHQFTFQVHVSNAGPSALPAAASSSAPVQEPASAPAFFTTQFRGAFEPVMYTGPPQKSTRKAGKVAGKSKSKAAGKPAPE